MIELEEQRARMRARARVCVCVCVCARACVKFCCKLGKNFTETFQLLKMQSSLWMAKGSPRPKKAQMSRSKIKVLLVVFFDWKGIVEKVKQSRYRPGVAQRVPRS